ncbi:Dps family protein [Maritalea porphyrae]|uniref:DNA starvation/stationary phase protection protein n=1 Tax=Maritalea porphyrae TaxID=880732 RepID=A0ABQ5UKZ1_9HYPH|nr:DNA starvation/stationary phase protection protein [Maritalea porphyrae]GLQ15943.1 DNA starvation/stationary phase protection protein [Maritalea porphyrae]
MSTVANIMRAEPKNENTKTGLDKSYQKQIAEQLSDVLIDSYKLMIKSHVYHWNVVGPLFKPLHELTEEHYQDLFAAIDVLAERIRAIGHTAPFVMSDASNFAPQTKELDNCSAKEMVEDLIEEHEAIARKMRSAAEAAGDGKDMVTEDLLTARLTFHEKALWMLRATISE